MKRNLFVAGASLAASLIVVLIGTTLAGSAPTQGPLPAHEFGLGTVPSSYQGPALGMLNSLICTDGRLAEVLAQGRTSAGAISNDFPNVSIPPTLEPSASIYALIAGGQCMYEKATVNMGLVLMDGNGHVLWYRQWLAGSEPNNVGENPFAPDIARALTN